MAACYEAPGGRAARQDRYWCSLRIVDREPAGARTLGTVNDRVIHPMALAEAEEMAHAASNAYPFMGAVSDHLAEFMPKVAWELPPSEDVDAYLLDRLLGDRATVAYAYAARSLDLLRSITALAGCALVDGTEILARSCIEHEAAAVIAAMGSEAVFDQMLRSSFKWLSFHARLSRVPGRLPTAPPEWTDGGMGWAPKRLFIEAIAIAEAGDYSVERVRQMR